MTSSSYYTPLVVLTIILLGNANIHAETETRQPTKHDLCKEAHGKCFSFALSLHNIAFETNNEAMRLKLNKEHFQFDIRDIKREIQMLRHRLANPSSPPLNLPLLGRSGVGIGMINFQDPTFENCTSVVDCVHLLTGINTYWKSLEDMKHNYQTEIDVLQSKKDALINIRQELQQRIANNTQS